MRCPLCGSEMVITEMTCPSCGLTMRGRFPRNEFTALPEEKLEFLRLFLKTRGNLSEVAKRLGVSYPTARARLDELLRDLGYETEASSRRLEVLEMLERGEITVEEALKLLEG